MPRKIYLSLLIILSLNLLVFQACNQKRKVKSENYRIGAESCVRQPYFIKQIGMNPERSAFTTLLNNKTGVCLVEFPKDMADTANYKIYQHDSWKQYGHMGSLTSGIDGSEFVAPVPVVNTLGRSLSDLNRIFRIDPVTEVMKPFVALPKIDSTEGVVPYAILGLYYDCHSKKIHASSVAGSTRDNEKGVIYLINPDDGKIEDKLVGFDAIGLFVSGITGAKVLYFGSARNSNIYGIELADDGTFIGKPKIEFSLEQKGPRGDDKARRIRQNKQGILEVYGVEFNFNLTANTQIEQSLYQFEYLEAEEKWEFKSVR
jgi:hypothetical protein